LKPELRLLLNCSQGLSQNRCQTPKIVLNFVWVVSGDCLGSVEFGFFEIWRVVSQCTGNVGLLSGFCRGFISLKSFGFNRLAWVRFPPPPPFPHLSHQDRIRQIPDRLSHNPDNCKILQKSPLSRRGQKTLYSCRNPEA